MNKVNVDNGHITELKDACTMYFNLFASFLVAIVLFGLLIMLSLNNSALLFEQYKIGLGIISIQGKDLKHSELKQELKTGTNRSCEVGENGKWHICHITFL